MDPFAKPAVPQGISKESLMTEEPMQSESSTKIVFYSEDSVSDVQYSSSCYPKRRETSLCESEISKFAAYSTSNCSYESTKSKSAAHASAPVGRFPLRDEWSTAI